jgi:hypothetical protein
VSIVLCAFRKTTITQLVSTDVKRILLLWLKSMKLKYNEVTKEDIRTYKGWYNTTRNFVIYAVLILLG